MHETNTFSRVKTDMAGLIPAPLARLLGSLALGQVRPELVISLALSEGWQKLVDPRSMSPSGI
jgi:hypothetical protein